MLIFQRLHTSPTICSNNHEGRWICKLICFETCDHQKSKNKTCKLWFIFYRKSIFSSSPFTAQKKKEISIKDLFSKCNQIRRKQQIWSHLLKKSLMENLIFCAVFAAWGKWKTCSRVSRVSYMRSRVSRVNMRVSSKKSVQEH